MQSKLSIQQKLEKASLTARYKLFDNQIKLVGKSSLVSRFKIERNQYEDDIVVESVKEDTVEVTIVYPAEIPISRLRNNNFNSIPDGQTNIYLFDVLPIDVYVKWTDNIIKGDFLLDIIKDENGNSIKILLKISEELFTPGSYGIVYRKLWAALYNGEIPVELQQTISQINLEN